MGLESMPEPRKSEGKKAFISRCAEYMAKHESDKPKDQRLAICYSKWRNRGMGRKAGA